MVIPYHNKVTYSWFPKKLSIIPIKQVNPKALKPVRHPHAKIYSSSYCFLNKSSLAPELLPKKLQFWEMVGTIGLIDYIIIHNKNEQTNRDNSPGILEKVNGVEYGENVITIQNANPQNL